MDAAGGSTDKLHAAAGARGEPEVKAAGSSRRKRLCMLRFVPRVVERPVLTLR